MKPIRSNELEFFNTIIEDKFRDKRQTLETDLNQEAQKMADKQSSNMAKQCGVDKEIKALEIADKKYKDFLATKELQEDKLFHTVRDIGTQLTAKLERLNKVREWNKSFDDFKPKENGVDYFTNKLDDCCYDEAYRLAKKSHKVYNKLQDMKTASRVILHTGSDINSTVTTLKSEMAKAGIDLPVPTHLLQLSQ
jgi:hypothetical protein|tara:strand:- start:45 stop:626 length:582 start_codon:yes stop_codon:yes gene_type:complete